MNRVFLCDAEGCGAIMSKDLVTIDSPYPVKSQFLSKGKLFKNSVVKKFFTTAANGKKYKTKYFNLN